VLIRVRTNANQQARRKPIHGYDREGDSGARLVVTYFAVVRVTMPIPMAVPESPEDGNYQVM